jgi:hypothetical protein
MKSKIFLLVIGISMLIGLSSCFLGPQLQIEFSFSTDLPAPPTTTDTVNISYTIYNTSTYTLNNCKLKFQINYDDFGDGGIDIQDTIWLPPFGANLSAGDNYPGSYSYSTPHLSDVISEVFLIGAGFDDPNTKQAIVQPIAARTK